MNLKGIAIASHPPVIIPEIGGGRVIQAEQTVKGMKSIAREIARIKPDTIVCITPHGNLFRDGVSVLYDNELSGDLSAFTPDETAKTKTTITKKCDMTLLDNLRTRWIEQDCRSLFINPKMADERGLSMQLDHGAVVPLYYIDKAYSNYQIIHITVSGLSLIEHYRMGRILREAIEIGDKRTVILACADQSHYHRHDEDYTPLSEKYDESVINSLQTQDYYHLLTMDPAVYEPAGQCGLRPMVMALGAVDSIKTQSKIFAYEKPFGVGYLEAFVQYDLTAEDFIQESLLERFKIENLKAFEKRMNESDIVSGLALKTVDLWVKKGLQLNIKEYLTETENDVLCNVLKMCCGVFVTLTKSGELRGCMGTISPVTENVAAEIVMNAIQAASYDPRFLPIEPEELPYIESEVSLLYDFEPVEDLKMIDPKQYGLIIEEDLQRGLLLPDLPGIDTPEKQIAAVKRKAGIIDGEDDTDHKTFYTRFKTKKYVSYSDSALV